jgi:rieske iron-sulfur protein
MGSNRRSVLQAALGTSLGLLLPEVAIAQAANPRNARPQDGDRFVFAGGERKGIMVTLADLPAGGPPVAAYPQDPGNGIVRDGSRLNQVLLIRLDPAELTDATRARAVQGIIAYSAICTHTGCDSWAWENEKKLLKCPCHDSEFDAKDGARVANGPAPRRLAALPLKIIDGVVMAAGNFAGRVGFQQG